MRLFTLHVFCHEHAALLSVFDEEPERLLDVGCSSSDVVLAASTLGFDTHGCDLLPYRESTDFPITVPLDESTYGARIVVPAPEWPPHICHDQGITFKFTHGDFALAKYEPGSFDTIIALSSIEHFGIPTAHGHSELNLEGDVEAMAKIRTLLAPGGTVYLMVPAASRSFIHDNTRHYDVEMLSRLLDGFCAEVECYQFNRDPETSIHISARDRFRISSGEVGQFIIDPDGLSDNPYASAIWMVRMTHAEEA